MKIGTALTVLFFMGPMWGVFGWLIATDKASAWWLFAPLLITGTLSIKDDSKEKP